MFKVFTICSGEVLEGAEVEKFTLKGAGLEIPAIIIGEEGRGRQLGVLPVSLPASLYEEWQEKGSVIIRAAEIGKTKTGRPKLLASTSEEEFDIEKAIIVLRTKIGFRGSNEHTGDLERMEKDEYGIDERPIYKKFPGQILTTGWIAQGAAGRMGGGEQLIAILPKDVVFRTAYSGHLYGAPSEHYYLFDGEKLISLTKEERSVSELF